ncbi:hypothetical protein LA080_012362 [Diaporthe eres]|nr:hypothetical protein LA080_012362 [Diaporthe eres]
MDDALHDVERAAGVALHTIIGLKRRISGHLDASDLHLIYDELIELTTMLEDVSELNTKTFSGTTKENLDILRAIYRDIRVILKTCEDVREMCPSVEDVSPNNAKLSSNSELIAERRPRRPIKERITIIYRLLRERRLSLLSKLVVLNTVKLIETYYDEGSSGQNTGTRYDSQNRPLPSPLVVSELPEGDRNTLDWPEQKSIPQNIDNEKYLSSEMFPVFKHMGQEGLRKIASKSGISHDSLQSPRSPSLQQLALSDMRYERSKKQHSYFQHLDQAFSKITHSPPTNEPGTRPFSAAITASFSDGIGAPELLIRVCRVVSTSALDGYYNIFGYISRRDVESIKEAVLRKRVSVTDVLDTGMTPIGFALRHFSVPMVRFLLQEGADLFQEGPSGVAPPGFMMALEKIYTDPDMPTSDRTLLEELLPLDTIIEMAGLSPLHKVVLGIRCLDLGELLRLEVCPVDKLDYSGRTALHWAAAKGDAAAVSELLDAGAQIECKTRLRSESPLMIACRTGANPEAVRVLLAAGADVNTHDSYGQTPLCLTAGAPGGHSRIEIAAALLDAGANINVEQGYARATALDFACVGSHFEMVKFLIDAGADIGHHDRDGSTPLMNAVIYHARKIVEVLLQRGVDICIRDNDGKNVLHCVAEVSNEDMMRVFATTGPWCVVDPEQRDNNGRTPLDTFDARTISAPFGLREKFVELLQIFAERYSHSLSVEDDDADEEQFFDASDKWDDANK